MEYRALKRVRLYGGEKDSTGRGRLVKFKANKRELVPQWVLDKDPSLLDKVEKLGEPDPLPEPAPAPQPPPPASQPPKASDDGPGAGEPAGAPPKPSPVPAPQEPPKRRGRPKGSKSKTTDKA